MSKQQEKLLSNMEDYRKYQRDYHRKMRTNYYINMVRILAYELTKLDECPQTKSIIEKLIAKYQRQIRE